MDPADAKDGKKKNYNYLLSSKRWKWGSDESNIIQINQERLLAIQFFSDLL